MTEQFNWEIVTPIRAKIFTFLTNDLLSRGGSGVELATILSCVTGGVGVDALGLLSCFTHFVKACNYRANSRCLVY